MKKLAYIIVLVAALAAGQALAVQVTQIALNYENGAVVARVTADGPFQFRHQTEVPKEGKGDRMILDLIGVTTGLSAKNYADLPPCGILSIRTGQFAVTPEKVVRVVFDLGKAPVYQVEQQGNSVKVTFTDQAISAFTSWNSGAPVKTAPKAPAPKPTVAVVQTNTPPTVVSPVPSSDKAQTTETDRLVSLSGDTKPSTQPSVTPATPIPSATVAVKPTQDAPTSATSPTAVTVKPVQPEVKSLTSTTESPKPVTTMADANAKPNIQPAPQTPSQKPVPVATTGNQIQQALSAKPSGTTVPEKQPTPAVKADEAVTAKPATAAQSNTPSPAPYVLLPDAKATKPEPEAAKTNAAVPTVTGSAPAKPADTNTKPATVAIPAPLADEDGVQLAEAENTQSANPDLPANKSTSRFRRTATADAKIKGTMVAEFPQRLVVKYESMGNRDPFATLVDDSRTYNTPVENRVPNIDGLRLVGIIESDRGASDNRALFEDKNGYSYILSSGDKVQRGYVLRVESDRVYFQIFEYGWSRTVALAIENAN